MVDYTETNKMLELTNPLKAIKDHVREIRCHGRCYGEG